MMHTITHLKAPWPAAAKVGDVIRFTSGVPVWALGKCVPAPDDAEATVEFAQAEPEDELEDDVITLRRKADDYIEGLRDEHGKAMGLLQDELATARQDLGEARSQLTEQTGVIAGFKETCSNLEIARDKVAAEVVDLRAKLADAETAAVAAAAAAAAATGKAGKK